MTNIKKISLIGILSALYVVCSLTLKIPMGVGAIALDMGYLVLTFAAFAVGGYAAIVGGLGALIESALFSPYGISWGWVIMNIIIGLICGLVFKEIKLDKIRGYVISGFVIITAVFIGIVEKTAFECWMYSIPILVKLPKSAVAFAIDTAVMLIGLPITKQVLKAVKK